MGQCRGLLRGASTHGSRGAANAELRSGRLARRQMLLKERHHLRIEPLVKRRPVKPGASRQISGAASASAGEQGARNA
jgi:hypothetical protein